MDEARWSTTTISREGNPQLNTLHHSAIVVNSLFGVRDPDSRRHEVDLSRSDDLLTPERVAVQGGTLDEPGDRGETVVGMRCDVEARVGSDREGPEVIGETPRSDGSSSALGYGATHQSPPDSRLVAQQLLYVIHGDLLSTRGSLRAYDGPVVTPTVETAGQRPRVRRPLGPLTLIAAALTFNLWSLWAEHTPVNYPNDSAMHLQMSTLAHNLLAAGSAPLDHWYGFLSLGSPFFVEYQSSSAILIGELSRWVASPAVLFAWSLYLLLSLWPLAVYYSARLLELGPWSAGVSALLAPLLVSVTGHGFEHKSYVWIGNGLWSQEWAMWTLPLAWGATWQFLRHRRHLVLAVVALGATIAFHFLTAYAAVLGLGVLVLVTPSRWRTRVPRASLVLLLGLGSSAWVTVPLLHRLNVLAVNQFQVGTVINNSYGGARVVSWLASGALFDSGRLPLISVLAALGVLDALRRWRHEETGRVLVALFVVFLILFTGRPTMSWLIDLIPGNQNLLLQRYIAELQLVALYLGARGARALVRVLAPQFSRGPGSLSPHSSRLGLGALALSVVVLSPAWLEVHHYDQRSAAWISYENSVTTRYAGPLNALIALAEREGGGRVYAGMPSNWGRTFYLGDVPVYIYLEQHLVDTVGFTLRTSSLMTDPEAYFDERNPGDYALFGVHWLLLPTTSSAATPPVPATLVRRTTYFALWRLPSRGLVRVVDTVGQESATTATLGPLNATFLASSQPEEGRYLTVGLGERAPAPPTLGPDTTVTGAPGVVLSEHDALITSGSASATVSLSRRAVVVLAASFDPGWRATLDGRPVATQMVSPALVAVPVPPGRHRVVFTYVGQGDYSQLYLLALASLAVAVLVSGREWTQRRRLERTTP